MASQASIPITDHVGSNTLYYIVRYKLDSSSGWQTLSPNPVDTPVIITGLLDSQTYNVEITRVCTAGNQNNTTLTSGTAAFDIAT